MCAHSTVCLYCLSKVAKVLVRTAEDETHNSYKRSEGNTCISVDYLHQLANCLGHKQEQHDVQLKGVMSPAMLFSMLSSMLTAFFSVFTFFSLLFSSFFSRRLSFLSCITTTRGWFCFNSSICSSRISSTRIILQLPFNLFLTSA